MATSNEITAVGAYFTDLRLVRGSGGVTDERSLYVPLANLPNAVGGLLRPKVFCVQDLANQGAGRPDFGLYTTQQVQKGKPKSGQKPERGAIEVKPVAVDAWLTAASNQVTDYWKEYRPALATNLRDFVLVGEDHDGNPARLESFRLASSAAEFDAKLARPRAFASEVGPGLVEHLTRVLSLAATLTEPRDLAWLLASYARDGSGEGGKGRGCGGAPGVTRGVGGVAGRALRGRPGSGFLPLDPGADPLLWRVLRLDVVGSANSDACWCVQLARSSVAPASAGAAGVVPATLRSGTVAAPGLG